jgi:hypothetical protein
MSKHFGPAAAEMERRGKISERGDLNRDIAQRNADRQAVAAIEAEEQMLTAQIIDLKAERAMREARDAAKGRYDRLHETHRDVARDQFPGRYDDLRAAEPPHQVEREFTSNANRTAEPAAPIYDRDADNAEWEAKVADAAIGKDAGETRQQPADRAGKDATAETRGPSGEQHDRPEPQDTRPLSKAASEILTAWTLSRSAQQLEDALAARGIALAQVSPAEAEQSQRTAAFAKEVGNFAGVLKAGEIVAVTEHGDVHRLNQRTTGDPAPDIEARFPGIDRAALLNVADTKEVMQEAARATWRDERQAEREAARPATGIESMIADALKSTATGRDFAAAIDKEGLTIARVSEADVKALDALRQDAALAAVVAHTEAETDNVRHFATVQYGDLAAVTRAGDVFRVSPHHLDLTEIEHRLTEVEPRLPSVVEARAQSEINRETEAGFWAELREWYDEVRKDRADAIEGERALHSTVSTAEHTVEGMLDATEDALDVGSRAAGGAIGRLAKAVESILGGIFSFFGAAEPKLSPMQAELAARAADELAEARAGIAYEQAQDAARVAQIFAQDKQQQREQLERDTGLRERPGDRERERERER